MTERSPVKSDPLRHADESQHPFSAGVVGKAIRQRSPTQRLKAPVFDASAGQELQTHRALRRMDADFRQHDVADAIALSQ
jgi:hypothetical protein